MGDEIGSEGEGGQRYIICATCIVNINRRGLAFCLWEPNGHRINNLFSFSNCIPGHWGGLGGVGVNLGSLNVQ